MQQQCQQQQSQQQQSQQRRGMKRAGFLIFAPACLALTGTGCTHRTVHNAPQVPAHWRMRTALSPAAPRQLDPVQFRVAVTGSDGRPVSGAAVTISLSMPGMDMGPNKVAAMMSARGVYTAADRFTMPGRWQATVQARQGALGQSASFPVTVRQ